MDMPKIGLYLKTLRTEKGLTQAQLAEQLGVSNRTVSRWENGNTMPDFDILLILAKEYDVSIKALLNGGPVVNAPHTALAWKQVAVYTDTEKMRLTRRMHILFLLTAAGGVLWPVIALLGLEGNPLWDALAGFRQGISFGMLLVGALITSRYWPKIQAGKQHLKQYLRRRTE